MISLYYITARPLADCLCPIITFCIFKTKQINANFKKWKQWLNDAVNYCFLIFSPVLTPVQSTHETNLVYESFSVGSLHFVIFEIGGSLSSMTLRCGDDDDADLCYDYVLHPLSWRMKTLTRRLTFPSPKCLFCWF